MNKKKIVVGENFLHAHATNSSTLSAGHVVVDYDDWFKVVSFFTDELSRTDELRSYIEVTKGETEQPISNESQKCDQGKPTEIRPVPIGVTPRIIWIGSRIAALGGAITRYSEAKLSIPEDWVKEYNELLLALKE